MPRVLFTMAVAGPVDAAEALEAFAYRNQLQMRRRRFPPLYSSGIRYDRPPGERHWQSASELMESRAGDCEDLAAYRVAELRESGADPLARVMFQDGGRRGLWHVLVRRGDGTKEDPSAVLGMRAEG